MTIRIVPDQGKPSAAIEIPLEHPLPDYDLDQMEQPTPRDVDAILVSQGFRDLVDDARGVLMELLAGSGLEITQFTGAICPGDDEVYRSGLWIVVKNHTSENRELEPATLLKVRDAADKLARRINL